MIFKVEFTDKTEWCQAKSEADLRESYEKEYDDFKDIQSVTEISDDEAKTIKLLNSEYDENDPTDNEYFSLFEVVVGDDFCVVGSTEWV